MLFSPVLIIALAALAPPTPKNIGPPPTVRIGRTQLRLITGSKLKNVLVGHSLTDTPRGWLEDSVQAFYDRGRYSRTGDREVLHGSYVLRHDRYCAKLGNDQFCSAVYQSDDGRLAVMNLRSLTVTLVERTDAAFDSELAP